MRFPGNHKVLNKYIDLFGLEKIPFQNMKDKQGLLFFNGKRTPVQEELDDPESILSRVVEAWEIAIAPIRACFQTGSLTWEQIIHQHSDVSLLDFLRVDQGWSDELIEGFSKYGLGLGAYGAILDLSFVEILRLFIDSYESGNFQLKGGMESLSRAMLFDEEVPLHTRIRYGCKVTGVHKHENDDSYQVSYDSSGTSLRIRAQFVVMTVPLPHLKNITFEPALNPESQKAISDSHYVRAVKIMLQTKSPFWLEQGVDGMLVSDLPITNTYFAPPFPDSPKGMIIASYVWESGADVFFALSDEDKIKLAVENLTQVFPEMAEQYERGAVVEWKSGFCIFTPGQMKEHHNTLRSEVAPNVFLAGEHW